MTNFKEYFRSHLKENIRPMIYILAAVLVMTFLISAGSQEVSYLDYATQKWETEYYATLYVPVLFLCILAYILPVMEFSFFKKRINLDCAYSLPISRRAMGTVHYLTGLMILFGVFTLSYLLNFGLLLTKEPGVYDFVPMIAHYFLCLPLGFSLYAVMVFVFNQANTRGDGIWFMVLYTFVFTLILVAGIMIIENLGLWPEDYWYIMEGAYVAMSWGTIDTMTTAYQSVVQLSAGSIAELWGEPAFIAGFVFWIAAGIGAAVGFFRTFGKRRMEKTEEISDSFFGFRTLIPIYAVTGMIAFEVGDSIILWVIIELFALLGYTIYRRGFHYKKSDIAILCALLIFLFI